MPREIWSEGRVVGLAAYELYVKQHLAEDPDTPVATEREWLASSLGMGSSMILKFPNTRSNQTDYDDEYIDVPLPQGSKLAAANSIVATFFDGDITVTNMLDDYWAKRVDNYGTGIRNSYDPSGGVSYRLKNIKLSDMLDDLGYTFVRYNDIPTDAWSNPPTYIQDNDGIKYICLGKQCGYTIGTEIELNQDTGNINILPNEWIMISHGNIDFSHKYLRFIAQHDIWKPQQILWDNTVIHIDADMSVYHNYGVEQFGEGVYLRIIDNIYAVVSYSEADRYIDGTIHTDDIDEIPTYPTGMTSMSPGDLLDPNLKLTRDRLSDYLKIEDGIVIQPGTWSECEFNPPASDFEVNLKERPVIRFRVRGKITNNPYILLTGFTVRYVLCGTLGQDTSTNTESPQDGDFLGPAVFPWCNKVLFTVPDQYVTLFEKNYLNRYITSSSDDDSYRINNDTPVIDMLQRNGNERSITYYYENDNVEDESLYKHNVGIHGDASYAKANTKLDYHVADYSSLGSGQSVFVVYRKEQGLPPALYGAFVNSVGETKAYPIDSVAPGSIKMLHSVGDKGTIGDILSYYEETYPGSNGIYKDYNNSTLYTLDDRTINEGNNAGSPVPTVAPVANVNHFWMDAYVNNNTYDYIKDPKDDSVNISYNKIDAGRNSVTSLPFGNPVYATDEDGDHYENYVMSTKNSSVLENASYSDNDYITWYDLIRALAGNRKIDLLGDKLRDFKNQLEYNDLDIRIFKFTMLKQNNSAGSSNGKGGSWNYKGPNDYFLGLSDPTTYSNYTASNLFTKAKLDFWGYAQTYDDGTSDSAISSRTINAISTLTLYTHPSFNNFATSTYNKVLNLKSTSVSGQRVNVDGSSYNVTGSASGTITLSDRTVGVNSWIQSLILDDIYNVVYIFRLLRMIYPRRNVNANFELTSNKNVLITQGTTFVYQSSTCTAKIQVGGSTILQVDGIKNKYSGSYKPAIGKYVVFVPETNASFAGNEITLQIKYNDKTDIYSAIVTVSYPDASLSYKTLVFSGRTHTGDETGDIKVVLDIHSLASTSILRRWLSTDIDNIDITKCNLRSSSWIGGYVEGKAPDDHAWKTLDDVTSCLMSVQLSEDPYLCYSNGLNFCSYGAVDLITQDGSGEVTIGLG